MMGLVLCVVLAIDWWIHVSSDDGHDPLNESVLSCCSVGLSICRMKESDGSIACLFQWIVLVIFPEIVLAICWC